MKLTFSDRFIYQRTSISPEHAINRSHHTAEKMDILLPENLAIVVIVADHGLTQTPPALLVVSNATAVASQIILQNFVVVQRYLQLLVPLPNATANNTPCARYNPIAIQVHQMMKNIYSLCLQKVGKLQKLVLKLKISQ